MKIYHGVRCETQTYSLPLRRIGETGRAEPYTLPKYALVPQIIAGPLPWNCE